MHPPVCCLVLICKVPATAFCICNAARIGVCLSNRRGGFPRPPADFDVILRNGQDRSLRTKCILQGRAGAYPCRFCPLREGAVKCKAFDWGRDFFISLPPPFASGKSHLPLRGRGYGAPSRRPLRTHCIFIFQSERSRPFPTRRMTNSNL